MSNPYQPPEPEGKHRPHVPVFAGLLLVSLALAALLGPPHPAGMVALGLGILAISATAYVLGVTG